MSANHARLSADGPCQDDCGRLLSYLRNDYIRGLRVELGFYPVGSIGHGLKLEVIDTGLSGVDGQTVVNVWAEKTLFSRQQGISMADLYDLLMTAYRRIDKFFEVGEAAAPIRREE